MRRSLIMYVISGLLAWVTVIRASADDEGARREDPGPPAAGRPENSGPGWRG
jgi:hypothetical protein